jgi:hypothetical protein
VRGDGKTGRTSGEQPKDDLRRHILTGEWDPIRELHQGHQSRTTASTGRTDRALEAQVRELQRLLGKKAMENELLREAVSRAAGPKKLLLRSTPLPGDGL